MPKVSVVIPAYNAIAFLPKTLASVLQQSFTDFEVLIVDDGSTDNIGQWADSITDARVQLISQVNQGAPVARNRGITEAQGEYIAFLDADDLWQPTKLEKQVRYLDEHPTVGLVYTWTALIDGNDQAIGRVWTSHAEGNVWERIVVLDDMINSGSCPLVRRCCFETVGMFDPNLGGCQDWDMWIRIAAQYSFGVVKEVLTLYRHHSQGMSKNLERMKQNRRKVIEKTFQSAPIELLYLRNRSYGYMYLCEAWNMISQGDYQQAILSRQQALLHYPQLRYTENFTRLRLAIALTRYFGTNGYDGVRNLTHFVHKLIVGIAT